MNQLDFLSDVLEEFCYKHKLPFMSAADLLYGYMYMEHDLTKRQRDWLHTYINVWDTIQENS